RMRVTIGPNCPASGARPSTGLRHWKPYRPSIGTVNRAQKAAVLIAAIAIPAAAYSMLAPVKDSLCLASGATTYRLVHGAASPDFRIKISGDAVQPDLRVQWVDRAEIADFVLVDDGDRNGPTTCRSTAPVR